MYTSEFNKSPIYMQIREAIYNKIITGEYKSGQRLESEDKLAGHFGVSRITVSKALAELVTKGYLTRIQGSGTYVSKIRNEKSKREIVGLSEVMAKKGYKYTTRLIEKELIFPTKEIAAFFNIPLNEKVIHIKRIRAVNDEPLIIQDTYLNGILCMPVYNIDLENCSLYKSITKFCGFSIERAKDTIEAISASGQTKDILNVTEGFPLLLSRRLAYDKNDKPVELTYSTYRSDQYVLEIEVII